MVIIAFCLIASSIDMGCQFGKTHADMVRVINDALRETVLCFVCLVIVLHFLIFLEWIQIAFVIRKCVFFSKFIYKTVFFFLVFSLPFLVSFFCSKTLRVAADGWACMWIEGRGGNPTIWESWLTACPACGALRTKIGRVAGARETSSFQGLNPKTLRIIVPAGDDYRKYF